MHKLTFSFQSSAGNAHEVSVTVENREPRVTEVYCFRGDVFCHLESVVLQGPNTVRACNLLGNDVDFEITAGLSGQEVILRIVELKPSALATLKKTI